jgi:hypothetical protein
MTSIFGEVGKPIPGFENYDITNYGRVINTDTGKVMTLSPTQAGDLTVGLVRDGYQYRRSVKVLVAESFVKGKTVLFNTPIQVDGNKHNLHYMNIEWRPRWFAWEYSRQHHNFQDWYRYGPVLDITTIIEYEDIWEAAIATTSLCKDIYDSIQRGFEVFPSGGKYVYI